MFRGKALITLSIAQSSRTLPSITLLWAFSSLAATRRTSSPTVSSTLFSISVETASTSLPYSLPSLLSLVHRCLPPHGSVSQRLRQVDRDSLQCCARQQSEPKPRSQDPAALLHPAAAAHHAEALRARPHLPARRHLFTQTRLQRQREVPDSSQKDGGFRQPQTGVPAMEVHRTRQALLQHHCEGIPAGRMRK